MLWSGPLLLFILFLSVIIIIIIITIIIIGELIQRYYDTGPGFRITSCVLM